MKQASFPITASANAAAAVTTTVTTNGNCLSTDVKSSEDKKTVAIKVAENVYYLK